MLNITLLYFEGCPHWREAFGLVQEVCKEKGIPESQIRLVEVRNEDEASRYGFLGSPSIQINGTDIEKSRINDRPLFGCRIYRDNRNAGVPSRAMITDAIEEIMKK